MKNDFTVNGGIAYIKITRNQVTILDESDLLLISPHKWYAKYGRNTWYAVTNTLLLDGRIKTLRMHRLLMGLDFGDSREIDHIDGNGLDNRRVKLRIVTHKINQHNQHGKQHRNDKVPSSKFPGVCWDKYNKGYRAYIKLDSKSIYLGCFDDEHIAYNTYVIAKTIRDAGGSVDEIKLSRQINK